MSICCYVACLAGSVCAVACTIDIDVGGVHTAVNGNRPQHSNCTPVCADDGCWKRQTAAGVSTGQWAPLTALLAEVWLPGFQLLPGWNRLQPAGQGGASTKTGTQPSPTEPAPRSMNTNTAC